MKKIEFQISFFQFFQRCLSLAFFRVKKKKKDKLEHMYHKSIITPSPSLSILTHDR